MPKPALSVDELRAGVSAGTIDTVILAITDMQGRLQGKRFAAEHFVDDVLAHGTEGCNYLLAVDVEMNTVGGYTMSSWDTGYGDFVMAPDLSTLRRTTWHPGTALVLADVEWEDGAAVAPSPRQVLKRQVDRLGEYGWTAFVGTELEFMLFDETYESASAKRYAGLSPANQYNGDYSILGTSRVEPILRAIRHGMRDAGLHVESAKGECNFGQHEIAFKYDDAITTCDNHSVYKTGAKEIAAQQGAALTFMAKYDAHEGNSCHIHLSLRTADGDPAFAGDRAGGVSTVFEHFLAGQLAALREMTYLFAPNINSYKRYQPDSFAPTAVKWGRDNRTCALRVIGHGPSLRFENRVPGGDVNPYANAARVELAAFNAAVTDWERVRGFERM